MSSWSGKTRGGIAGYKVFVFLIKHTGIAFAYFLLFFVVFYYLLTSIKSVKASYCYFRSIQKFNFFRSCLSVYKNFFIFGQTLIDKIAVMSGVDNKLNFYFDGEEHLVKMVNEKTGGMLVSAHVGSFEIAGYLLKRINTKVHILMYEAEHQNIKKYLSGVYKDITAHIITIKEDMSHIYEIKKVFENKEFLCLHGDRFVSGSKTIAMTFMGNQAAFPTGPFYLAQKYKVPVSYVFAVKKSTFAYRFLATPAKYYYTEKINLRTKTAHQEQIIKDYIKALENVIMNYPHQWFNFYYFWEKKYQR